MKTKLTVEEMRAAALQHLNDFYNQACAALNGTAGDDKTTGVPPMTVDNYNDQTTVMGGTLTQDIEFKDSGTGLTFNFGIQRNIEAEMGFPAE